MGFFSENSSVLQILGILSVITFIGSLIAIPWVISRLPVNYFIQHRQRESQRRKRHPVAAKIIFIARNSVGLLFFLAGIAMLVLPGQGIITILIGVSLMDFHRKHTVIDYMIQRPKVITLLNWIRNKEKKPPFDF